MTAVTLRRASDVTPEEGFTFVAIHPGSVETDMNNATFGWVVFYFPVSPFLSLVLHQKAPIYRAFMGIATAAQWPASHQA